jgi:uncharacterized protein (DUF1810 family)
MKSNDPFDLNRFLLAQEKVYAEALAELKSGQKRTHWMWFVFPQVRGLGQSPISQQYAIRSLEEARQYLDHPVLGARLLECAQTVLLIEGRTVSEIFGFPDDLKLRSCMTLFASLAGPGSIFEGVLERYFHGERDALTLIILANEFG